MNLNKYLLFFVQSMVVIAVQLAKSSVTFLRSGGRIWMFLSTLLNVMVWAYAGSVAAQTSSYQALAYISEEHLPDLSRLVVYRAEGDTSTDLADIRVNGAPLTVLEQGRYAVICVLPQYVRLSLNTNELSTDKPHLALNLGSGENHYIKVHLSAVREDAIREQVLDLARPEILKLSKTVNAYSHSGMNQPCTTEEYRASQFFVSDADFMSADAKAQ